MKRAVKEGPQMLTNRTATKYYGAGSYVHPKTQPKETTMDKRKITDHVVNPVNDLITITVMDEPGQGGANHDYFVHWPVKEENHPGGALAIKFQNGPIKEFGVNGVTQEVLLAIVIDRLASFQAGQFACRENAIALTKLQEAQLWLQKRTRERMTRGVEGTNQK